MTAQPRLLAGVSRADITPPVGMQMAGFAARGRNTGYHDPLTATALFLTDGQTQAAVVACDLLFVSADFADRVGAEVERRGGPPAAHLLLCCSHTHYGPPVPPGSDPETSAMVEAYWAHLAFVLAGVVLDAAARQAPVRLGLGRGTCAVNVNRRERRADGTIILGQNPTGFTDREVQVVRLDTDAGQPLATLVNYPCHGVCLSGRWTTFSADFPGALRQVLEPVTGAPVLFLQGAAGNHNPAAMGNDYANARQTGQALAEEAGRVWTGVAPQAAAGLALATTTLELPGIRFGSREKALRLGERFRREEAELRQRPGTQPGHLRWLEKLRGRAEAAVCAWDEGRTAPGPTCRVQAMRFGAAALAATAGEVFAEIGAEVRRRSPLPGALFAAYTNGDIGYIPVPQAYEEGGYEVEMACRVDPQAAELLTRACLEQLARVAGPP